MADQVQAAALQHQLSAAMQTPDSGALHARARSAQHQIVHMLMSEMPDADVRQMDVLGARLNTVLQVCSCCRSWLLRLLRAL